MRVLRGVALFGLVSVFLLQGSATVAAETITKTDKLQVKAQVLAAHTVIIDDHNRIVQIASNTTEDVTPRVFRGTNDKANQVALTDEVYAAYRKLVPAGSSKVGILYQRSALNTMAEMQDYLAAVSVLRTSPTLAYSY